MNLIESAMQPFTKLIRSSERDSAGNILVSYEDGESFEAALILSGSKETDTAGNTRLIRSYTLTVDSDIDIEYGDIIRRDSDESLYRISGESLGSPPDMASFSFKQLKAEDFELETAV